MNLILSVLTLGSVVIVHAQQGEKGNSIIPFPRVGRSEGLIPFPRIGRAGQQVKRQMIPFPRVGKRPFWHMEPSYFTEYEDLSQPGGMVDPSTGTGNLLFPAVAFPLAEAEDGEVEKRGQNPNSGGGMWFGPRLGRKKRSVESSDSSAERGTLDMKTLLKILHNFNWAIVPVKERRNFTPRLGRSSHEIHSRAQPFSPRLGRSKEFASNEVEVDDEVRGKRGEGGEGESGGSQDPPSGPPFSPRLGRAEPFSPRLGRSFSRSDDRE